jgi:hypothetical protein
LSVRIAAKHFWLGLPVWRSTFDVRRSAFGVSERSSMSMITCDNLDAAQKTS